MELIQPKLKPVTCNGTVIFRVGNVLTRIENAEAISPGISKYLNIKKDGFVYGTDWQYFYQTGQKRKKSSYKPTFVNVYNLYEKTFPTGRLSYLTNWCNEQNISYEVYDHRKKPRKTLQIKYTGPVADGSNGMPPRPYQENASKLIKKCTRGIMWHATASGKTITAARMISDLGVKTLYIVPALDLLNQTVEELQDVLSDTEIGKIGEGSWEPQDITVATPGTLWARFKRPECQKLLKSIKFLIIDEAHHVTSSNKKKKDIDSSLNSWYIIAINCPAYYRVGLTGTPGKDIEQKRALLECALGRVIERVTTRELIDLNVINDVQINIHRITHEKTHSEYNDAKTQGILLNEQFNDYIVCLAITEIKQGKNVLLITNSKRDQGPLLVRLFENYGYNIPFVSGDDKSKKRQQMRKDFKSGKIQCLIGTVYREGVNFPKCDCGILCDGGKDEKRTIQFLGRILRKAKGKGLAQLHDFFHADKKHLKKHSRARLSHYIEEELDKIVNHKGIIV